MNDLIYVFLFMRRIMLYSEAPRSIIGRKGWNIISSFNSPLHKDVSPHCPVTNGETCASIGSICVPVRLMNKIKLAHFLVVPSVWHSLILGLVFLEDNGYCS